MLDDQLTEAVEAFRQRDLEKIDTSLRKLGVEPPGRCPRDRWRIPLTLSAEHRVFLAYKPCVI